MVQLKKLLSILHVCGGDPNGASLSGKGISVFSTYVEVILIDLKNRLSALGILHVCGGDPNNRYVKAFKQGYSPRMWR